MANNSNSRRTSQQPIHNSATGKNKHSNNTSGIDKEAPSQQPFGKINYWLMGGCILFIIIGFLLMLGPGSSVEEGFNPDIFSARRIAAGPAFTFLGFLLMAFAIIYRSPQRKAAAENSGEISSSTEE